MDQRMLILLGKRHSYKERGEMEAEKKRERRKRNRDGGEREIFHVLVHFPYDSNMIVPTKTGPGQSKGPKTLSG